MLTRNVELALGQFYRELTHINRFRAALQQPAEAQHLKLMQIVRANASTVFGRRHNFDKIHSVADYQKCVPPTTYEELQQYIEPMLHGIQGQLTAESAVMFATTSGTTGKPKYLPITESHLKDYAHAFQVHNYYMVVDHPRAASGRFLIFASNDEEGTTEGGLPYGAVSGLLRRRQSPLVQKYFSLPQHHRQNQRRRVQVLHHAAPGALSGCYGGARLQSVQLPFAAQDDAGACR